VVLKGCEILATVAALTPSDVEMRPAMAQRLERGGHPASLVRAAVQTDVGAVRERNEDVAYVDPRLRFFLLADGMGGRLGGDVASATAVDLVRGLLEAAAGDLAAFAAAPGPSERERVRRRIDRAVRDANDVVFARSILTPELDGMGTTLEVVVLLAGEVFVAHVGDSRTYLIRDRRAHRLTADHTVAREMNRAGTISDEEEARSPMRSVLTNVIGCHPAVEVDHVDLRVRAGDRLLLCSDGLYDHFRPDELAVLLSDHAEPASALAELVIQARARGGQDNITGIVIAAAGRSTPRAGV
jgi:PPM family protein phosphatase